MHNRFRYHFEPNRGWMNDPNGLIYYKGYYHAFFQHNPYAAKWDTMHWGHAVSKDMIHWEECEIALFPDEEYEDDGGCYSGSAIEKDGRLYLFYTSVSHRLGQTQSMAYSDDGFHFIKYEGNPVINHFPEDGCGEFRDPKVIRYEDYYLMVVGTKYEGRGRVVLYKSYNLIEWDYSGVLYESEDYGDTIECPDLFQINEKYVLMYSRIGVDKFNTRFIIGNFDGKRFISEKNFSPEMGPQFYAPQTFKAPDGRRIMIGWFYDWKMQPDADATYAGALSLPRELTVQNGKILINPIKEAISLMQTTDNRVEIKDNSIVIKGTVSEGDMVVDTDYIEDIKILNDGKAIEIFLNQGKKVISAWLT